ncbi:GxxExxY protein [Flavobacterium reichenbachii]|uniref:NADH:ubiquinone oxidoreductase n=1 Tax=Flavobacterium reichenbachii TaxID=362418 RepID=A0A085ZQC2_9FLAO|nr:GxxExxY protein [Flavobacterium reichenbachii]KFF06636.1 NADH:ubiquinone oxidoreductase [Flavobacterium reichenbachii]OXB18761.1 NADH:ubiquinone oxidoreductase [Flavobacterium reichenbachii]
MSDSNEYYYKKNENYKIVGICMEVHRLLGPGLLEIIYKDALEIEFKNHQIPYQREKEFSIEYKGVILPHKFYADFIVYDDIILEVKSVKEICNDHLAQALNYMKLADTPVGIIANFQNKSLVHK